MNDIAIKITNVDKVYRLYDKPIDRLKESLSITHKKYHKEHYALKDINFKVNKGETIGIIGTNGSGKSTLLKIITGVLSATHGEVEVNGKISALLELGAGFNTEYTGIENVYLNGTMMGYTKQEIEKKVKGIVEFADIGEFINQPVKTYSSGMFVRLAFAVAINVEPEILIVDEALSVGDNRFQAKCYSKIEELRNNSKTILLVTHDVDSVRKFCDTCIWIHKGHMKKMGDVEEVTAEYLAFTNNIDKKGEIKSELVKSTSQSRVYEELKPMRRWGEYTGLIKYVRLYNDSNERLETLNVDDKLKLEIIVTLDEKLILRNYLGIAIAIKNNKGQDLIVQDTFEKGIEFKEKGTYHITFSMKNHLVQGEYYIVTSLETRETQVPTYIDYVEGTNYFSVMSMKNEYGMLKVPFEVDMTKD